MAARYKQIKVPTLAGSAVSVRFDTEWDEYQVCVKGQPKATYHTQDRADALRTAQVMRNTQAQPTICTRCGDGCTVAGGVAACDTCGNVM
jgi:hypothetical protein